MSSGEGPVALDFDVFEGLSDDEAPSPRHEARGAPRAEAHGECRRRDSSSDGFESDGGGRAAGGGARRGARHQHIQDPAAPAAPRPPTSAPRTPTGGARAGAAAAPAVAAPALSGPKDFHGAAATERRLRHYLQELSRNPKRFPVGPKLQGLMDQQAHRGVRWGAGALANGPRAGAGNDCRRLPLNEPRPRRPSTTAHERDKTLRRARHPLPPLPGSTTWLSTCGG
jgi:hypothetical protein